VHIAYFGTMAADIDTGDECALHSYAAQVVVFHFAFRGGGDSHIFQPCSRAGYFNECRLGKPVNDKTICRRLYL